MHYDNQGNLPDIMHYSPVQYSIPWLGNLEKLRPLCLLGKVVFKNSRE